ncbi:uncharacterized protein DNG_09202 [Cephalotrichum gorgonifer]|uniref:Uncharacterized protein n=1 Tax=Cephalotrichum gorgonifer TaxID=2041049 RepID=A0AAE8SZX6_9PEZI|nr:uncharacterized protein DNG_09202 [Cephalotrichum gorgonifer]
MAFAIGTRKVGMSRFGSVASASIASAAASAATAVPAVPAAAAAATLRVGLRLLTGVGCPPLTPLILTFAFDASIRGVTWLQRGAGILGRGLASYRGGWAERDGKPCMA